MTLKQTIYMSLAIVCLVIGIHQAYVTGVMESYWILMLSVIFAMLFKLESRKKS